MRRCTAVLVLFDGGCRTAQLLKDAQGRVMYPEDCADGSDGAGNDVDTLLSNRLAPLIDGGFLTLDAERLAA